MKEKKSNVQNVGINLKLDWCSYKAAKWAVENWHYSKKMPAGKLVKIGVWENDNYIGAIIYGLGSGNSTSGIKYGLKKTHEVCELVRVALKTHKTEVSKMLSISIKMLKKQSPNLKMIISFADEGEQNHLGIIYQATNWVYTGVFEGADGFIVNGIKMHNRSIGAKGWKQSLKWLKKNIDPKAEKCLNVKHRYLYPLNNEIRKKISPLSKPYPKCVTSKDGVASSFQGEEAGSSPSVTL